MSKLCGKIFLRSLLDELQYSPTPSPLVVFFSCFFGQKYFCKNFHGLYQKKFGTSLTVWGGQKKFVTLCCKSPPTQNLRKHQLQKVIIRQN